MGHAWSSTEFKSPITWAAGNEPLVKFTSSQETNELKIGMDEITQCVRQLGNTLGVGQLRFTSQKSFTAVCMCRKSLTHWASTEHLLPKAVNEPRPVRKRLRLYSFPSTIASRVRQKGLCAFISQKSIVPQSLQIFIRYSAAIYP